MLVKKIFKSINSSLKIALVAFGFISFALNANAIRASKATVTSENPDMGLVYVTNSSSENVTSDKYKTSVSATNSSTKIKDETQTYYIYARPISNWYQFDGWYDGGTLISNSSEISVSILATSGNLLSPTSKTWTAKFSEIPSIVKVVSNLDYATASVYPDNNHPGEKVQLSVNYTVAYNGRENVMKNQNVRFRGWFDGETCVSTDENYSFVAGETATVLEARFDNIASVPVAGKYYRIRNVANRVLSLEGRYADESSSNANITSESNYNMDKYQMRWALGADHVGSDFPTGTDNNIFSESDDQPGLEIESTPSTLFYFASGSVSASEDDHNKTTITSQGVDLSSITGGGYSIYARGNDYPGYYYMRRRCTMGNSYNHRQVALSMGISGNNSFVRMIGGTDAKSVWNSALVFQPVDAEHIDSFWFGATASEQMKVGDSYWTSMYTAFPYQCVAEDGVEAYYVKSVAALDGKTYAAITKIESGIVPAYTPVILKCKGTQSKQNRLLPLEQNSSNMTPIADNLLRGELQIYTNSNGAGRKNYDASMRVFGISDGQLAFMRLDGTPQLEANKVWLDASSIADPDVPVIPAEGVGEDVVEGYFRILDENGNCVEVVSADGATRGVSQEEAAAKAGTVFYVKAVKQWESIATVCRLSHLSSQGVNVTVGALTPGRALRSVTVESDGKVNMTTSAGSYTLLPLSGETQRFAPEIAVSHETCGYASLYFDFPVIPEGAGMKCYTLSPIQKANVNGQFVSYAEFLPITGEIAARTPFVLEVDTEVDTEVSFAIVGNDVANPYTLEMPADILDIKDAVSDRQRVSAVSKTRAADDSLLRGVLFETAIHHEALGWDEELNEQNPLYRLQRVEYGQNQQLGYANASAGTLAANEAYLKPGAALENDMMLIGEPNLIETGIRELTDGDAGAEAPTVIYDLNGLEVTNPLPGHIYISRGRKILVK